LGKSDELITYFQKELEEYPKNENILRKLGYLYISDNQVELGEKYYRDALTINPKCARCYMNIGNAYAIKNDTKKALELYSKSISIDPKDAVLWASRAKLKEYMGDKFGALIDYNEAIKIDPNKVILYIERGNYNSNQGYFSLALSDINKAIELDPNNYSHYFKRSSLHYNKQMLKEAMSDINIAIQLDSTQHELFTGRGAIYASYNEHHKAISDYTKAIQLNPKGYLPYYNRALDKYEIEDMDGSCADIHECFSILNKYDPKNELIDELEYSIRKYCDSTKAGYYYQRGIALYNLQQFKQAVIIYSKGLKKFPNNSMILSFRGNAYFMLMDYENALSDYYASIDNKENVIYDVKANQRHTGISDEFIDVYVSGFGAEMFTSIAESKFALGQYEEALLEINKGIKIAPDLKEIGKEKYYNVRGNIFLALKKFELAKKDFDKCILLNSGFEIAYVNRAIANVNLVRKVKMTSYSISGGANNNAFNANWSFPIKTSFKKSNYRLISALSDCDKAIDLNSELSFAYNIRGQIKKMLMYDDYCYDLLKAMELGYSVDIEFLNNCIDN